MFSLPIFCPSSLAHCRMSTDFFRNFSSWLCCMPVRNFVMPLFRCPINLTEDKIANLSLHNVCLLQKCEWLYNMWNYTLNLGWTDGRCLSIRLSVRLSRASTLLETGKAFLFLSLFLFLRGGGVSPSRTNAEVLCGSHRCHRWGVYVCIALPSTLSGPGSSSRLTKRS